MSLLVIALIFGIPFLIYKFLVWNFDHWNRRGVTTAKTVPILGSFPNFLSQKQHFAKDTAEIYTQHKHNENYVGVFLMRTPMLLVLDPKIACDVFVGAFKHFLNNDTGRLIDKKKDPLIGNNPFVLMDEEWREQRSFVTPGLTGSRIKVAYSIMQGVCHQFCDFIEKEMKTAPKDGINGKSLALRFTCENVCDSVLGVKAKSFTENPLPVGENVRKFAEENTVFLIYSLMSGIWPGIVNFYKAKFIPKDSEDFFLDLMRKAFKLRLTSKVERQDFMNYLLTMQEKKHISDTELASHSMTFLIDGLDTTAAVISHTLLLLARNPSHQEILRKEIRQSMDENSEISFEKLSEMPYLDACIHETIRIFPPGLWSTKLCTEPYEFVNKNGRTLQVRVGDTILIPIYALHHDADYYPEPEKFDPERFMPDNGGVKKYRDMGVFFGFGNGPRVCLGMRFALTQMKSAISAIINQFEVKVNPKTIKENRLDPKAFLALQDGGVWLDFEKIK